MPKNLLLAVSCALWLLGPVVSRAGAVDRAKLPPVAKAPVQFERDIQPIFARHCYSCHGPDKQKGEFRLDVKEKALSGGDSGPAIVVGHSADSPLI
ncbi:MAG: hypothetical protein H7X97_08080, partial [Opitutaceae bacterium]|nr:hypothetical protein [Verrucomicrobiales bacterium]